MELNFLTPKYSLKSKTSNSEGVGIFVVLSSKMIANLNKMITVKTERGLNAELIYGYLNFL